MRLICTLLTDFGEVDPYVAAMKGVLLSRAPGVQLVDLSHQIPPQNVERGSLFWGDCIPWFPDGAVHLGVIDPGVGTTRRICVAEGSGQILVCPDNGLLTDWWNATEEPRAFEVTREDLRLGDVSSTFHGRDIFSPIAAALASGAVKPEECGPMISPILLERSSWEKADSGIRGRVLLVDHFGNCVMNIPGHLFSPGTKLTLNGTIQVPRVKTYGDASPGELVLLEGSTGLLEVAVAHGSAAMQLGLVAGNEVVLELI